MKMKKRLLSILLSLVMLLGLMPGMSLTAYAATDTYTTLKNNATVVKFNNYDWYIIADDSTAADAGTVTLLAADTSFGTSTFKSDNSSNSYNSSDVKAYLDNIVAGKAGEGKPNFKAVADAIQPVTLTTYKYDSTTEVAETTENAKLYLLSTSEAAPYKDFYFSGVQYGSWWLRSPGGFDDHAAFVRGEPGYVYGYGDRVTEQFGVRPALKLDLSKVEFNSETNTFALPTPSAYAGYVPAATDDATALAAKVVKFNGYNWYIIEDNSTAVDAGTVTLLAADTSFGTSKFHDSSNAYSSSTVKSKLDALTAEGGSFAGVKDAIVDTGLPDVGVTGAKLYLLSTSEAGPYANFNFTGAQYGGWWLRSQGYGDYDAAFVYGGSGDVNGNGLNVGYTIGVRPALTLDLSKVTFDSTSKTFSLKQTVTEYPLWVGGTQVTSANAADVFGDGKVSYSPATTGDNSAPATLTLNNYTYSGEGHKEKEQPDSPLSAIYYPGTDPLTIQLSGTNSITRTGKTSVPSSEEAYGIHSTNCNLTIEGNSFGSLTVTGGELNTTYGIFAKTVTIKNADVTAKGIGSSYGTGIYGSQGVTIQNAAVNAEGKNYGIVSANNGFTEILGNSSVTATGSNKAINGTVKNVIAGTGWTDKEGTEGRAAIAVSTEGQSLTNYKKVHFLAHTHSFTYSASGATITATCTAEGCDLPPSTDGGTDHVATLTIGAPTLTTYGQTGDGVSAEATITDADGIRGDAAVSYYQATKIGDTYTKTGTALNAAPTNAGDYVAEITLGEGNNAATAAVGYTVAKAAQAAVPSGVTISTIGVDSVFLTGVEGEEYIVVPKGTETLDWTAAQTKDEYGTVEFSNGLNEATEYTAYARVAETDNYLPGEAVTQDFATQLSSFGYSGYMIVGGMVQASVDIEVEGIDFQWYRGDAAIEGARADSYTIQETDADQAIGVRPFLNGQPLWDEIYVCGEAYYGTVNFYREYSENEEELVLLHSVDGLKYGDTVQAPDSPRKDGYIFAGWASYFFGESEPVTFPMSVEDSLDVYGKWNAIVYYDPTPAAETVTIPVSGEGETVNVTVEIKDDTATIIGADVDKVLEAQEVGTVTIDLSALKENVTKVVIPNELLEKVADAVADEDNTADALEIKLPTGSVTFDAEAVAAIRSQAEGKDLKLNLEDVKVTELEPAQQEAVGDLEIEVVLDAYLTSGGERISDFGGGSATVSVPYTLKDGQTAQGLVVWYVASDGTRSQVPASYDGENVVFTVPHFSNYVIAYDAEKAAACPQDDTCPISAFDDADPTAWYHDGVHFVLAKGIMSGNGDGTFDPNGSTSRAMMAQILYNLEGRPMIRSGIPFEDVAEDAWYAMAVSWAESQGIMDGYGNGKFGPDDDLTREQLVTIFYRYAKYKGMAESPDANIMDYDDVFDISSWAVEAFRWSVQEKLVEGVGENKLAPKGSASRAMIAAVVMRYLERFPA